MSTNRNVANLSIAFVKTLVKMAGFGFAADMIDGAQECLNLLADLKNDTLGNPNAEMIRGLNGAVKSELDAIEDALNQNGMSRKQIKQAVAQLSDAARQTIKDLAEDDDALIRAVQQPERFAQELRAHAAPLPDLSGDEIQPHYETILDRIAEEFHTLAPWSPNFDRVALADLLRCFPALTDQVAQLERTMNVRFDNVDEGQRKIIKLLETRPAVAIKPVVFGSRPEVVTDDRFVKRDEHEQLNALVTETTTRRTVLVGMRGCGKTQLAAALAIKCEDAKWNLVAWLNAGSRRSITSELVELAKRLAIDTSDNPPPDTIVRRCLDHLKSEKPSNRMIVFDNVEDINHLTGLIPHGGGLRVIATTTNKVGWEDQGWNSIEVGVFDRRESIDYLLTVTQSDDHDAADALAERLGDLPLALAQAAATARNGDLSLARYLDRLDSYGSERVIHPVPGDYYTEDVTTALWMALEDAIDGLDGGTKETARRQLGALALLAESGVPTRWLDPTIEQLYDDESPGTQHDRDQDAHDALTDLIHRSIVQQSKDGSTTMLHRLQAQVLRESWTQEESEQARESAAALLGSVDVDAFPRDDTYSRRKETHDLLEQLRSINEQPYSLEVLKTEPARWALNNTLKHTYDLGFPEEATTLSGIVRYVQSYLGSSSREARTLANNLAVVYQASGHLDIAISIYERNYEEIRRVIGSDESETLEVRSNLLYAYQTADRVDEAIRGYKQLVIDCNRVLGCPHQLTLTVRNNEAAAHQAAGLFQEAIRLYEEVLRDHIHYLSSDHPNTLATRNNLAMAYQYAGQLNKAIEQYEMVRNDGTRIMGADHPDTLTWRDNLASAYLEAGRLTESVILYEQVLTDRTRVLGEDHPDTLASRNNLACAYASYGKLPEAIMRWQTVCDDCLRILGPDHPLTATVRGSLEAAKRELEQREDDSSTE